MSLASRQTGCVLSKKNADWQWGVCVIRFNHLIQKSSAGEGNSGNNAVRRQEANHGSGGDGGE